MGNDIAIYCSPFGFCEYFVYVCIIMPFCKKRFVLYLYISSIKYLTCKNYYEKDNHNRRGK